MSSYKYIPVEYTTPHYSTKLWRSYYHYVKRFYSAELFIDILEELNMPLDYILQDGNWVSNQFSIQFMEKLKHKTGNDDIALLVGRFNLDAENINPFEHALIKLMPPYLFFRVFKFQFKKANRFLDIEIIKKKFGFFEYRLKKNEDTPSDPSVCKSLIGTFESLKKIYNLSYSDVDHSACIHSGSPACVFKVKYSSKSYWLKTLLYFTLFIFLIAAGTYSFNYIVGSASSNLVSLASTLFFVSILATSLLVFVCFKFRGLVKNNFIHSELSRKRTLEMYESRKKLNRRFVESKVQRELSLKLIAMTDPDEICDFCVSTLIEKFDYSQLLLMLLDEEGNKLETYSVHGMDKVSSGIKKLSLVYPDPRENALVFTKILENGETKLINDIDSFASQLTEQNKRLIETLQINSMIASPIQTNENKFGLLVVGNEDVSKKFASEDKYLVESMSRLLSLFFQNAKLFSKETKLRRLFQKYVPPVILDNVGVEDIRSQQPPKERQITSMFVDLRGFSKLSEKIDPSIVVKLINHYFEFVTLHIENEKGLIDNLIGDGVVAFFVSDDQAECHRTRALRAAASIITKLSDIEKEFVKLGFDFNGVGVGVHSGKTIVGTIGCDRKLNYTAIGDVVNLASRLEECSKKYFNKDIANKRGIVIASSDLVRSSETQEYFHSHGPQEIRGRKKMESIYEMDVELAEHYLGQFIDRKVA